MLRQIEPLNQYPRYPAPGFPMLDGLRYNHFNLNLMLMISLQSFGRIPIRTVILFGFLATVSLVAETVHAGGIEAPNPEAGQTLAETRCARCHAVGRDGASPVDAAPAFRHLGRKWPVGNLAEALAEGIVVGHPVMPAFAFSPPEIEDFLGWLQAIQEK